MARLFSRRRRWRSRTRNGGRRINPWLAVPLILLGLMVAGGGAFAIAGFVIYRSYADDLVPIEEVLAQQSAGGAEIYDRNGRPLYEFVDDLEGLRRPVPLSDVSPLSDRRHDRHRRLQLLLQPRREHQGALARRLRELLPRPA